MGIGFDYTAVFDGADDSVTGTASGTSYIRCEVVQGQYDCYGFPCLNNGYCIDGVDEYTCSCPFGYEGKNCENEIDECSEQGQYQVCHEYATCANAEGSYACSCNPGFFGDGYATDQTTIRWGSVLVGDSRYGWLDRGFAANYTDGNADGVIDRYGCTDINDCSSTPCFNGGRCIDLWDGHYNDNDGSDAYTTIGEKALAQSNSFECDCTVTLPQTRFAGDYCELDVDECESGMHNCDKDDRSECTNNEGSFACNCRQYWEGDGYSPETNTTDWACTRSGRPCRSCACRRSTRPRRARRSRPRSGWRAASRCSRTRTRWTWPWPSPPRSCRPWWSRPRSGRPTGRCSGRR